MDFNMSIRSEPSTSTIIMTTTNNPESEGEEETGMEEPERKKMKI